MNKKKVKNAVGNAKRGGVPGCGPIKTYAIELNDSELTLIIWGLIADAIQNGGPVALTSILNDGTTSSDTDQLVAKLSAVRKQGDPAAPEIRNLVQAAIHEVKHRICSRYP